MFAGNADAAELPADRQALLLARVLSYDRNMTTRTGDLATVLLVQSTQAPAMCGRVERAIGTLAGEYLVQGRKLEARSHVFADDDSLRSAIEELKPAVVYLCADVEELSTQVHDVAAAAKVPTITGSDSVYAAAASIGILREGNSSRIHVNLPRVLQAGGDLDTALLRVSEVIR